ncbi:patatin-like phospholipase family protein [Rhizobium sp. 16-449-1b]|uniref:patatin-like phospholipase family protein n=1 Tax=Rhizobium sp. 16-449-1b TaxID=2819989 RepID=UPI0032B02079
MREHPDPVDANDGAQIDGLAPIEGAALCLSGGGYRAMLFHVGAIWRLHEAGILTTLKHISSVSGGSITAAKLALSWDSLTRSPAGQGIFQEEFVTPLRKLASTTVDVFAIARGFFSGGAGRHVAAVYDRELFHGASLQDLPDLPVFTINSTNVQSGALWRFQKAYMRDYRVGEVVRPGLNLSQAVAASSAFPPFLSPFELKLTEAEFTPDTGDDLQCSPFTSRPLLTDGGVYDNLGLETAWKRFKTVLVSDGGGKIEAQRKPWRVDLH